MTDSCEECRFWSEMVAQAINGNPLEALCLADGGPKQGEYTTGRFSCSGFKPNDFGAIDDPPNYGEESRAAYLAEEGPDALKAASV